MSVLTLRLWSSRSARGAPFVVWASQSSRCACCSNYEITCSFLVPAVGELAKAPAVREAQSTPVVNKVKNGRVISFLLHWKRREK